MSLNINKTPEKLEQMAAHYVGILLIVFVAYQCAKLTWSLLESDIEVIRPTVKTNLSSSQPKNAPINISSIVSAHIFGEKQIKKPTKPVEAVVNKIDEAALKETSLNIKIHGISASDNPKWASAILSSNGKQDSYHIGDTIPGSSRAILYEIKPDKVIIDRGNNKYETLHLADTKFSTVAIDDSPPEPDPNSAVPDKYRGITAPNKSGKPELVDRRSDKDLAKKLSGYRNQLISAPGSLSNLMRITTVKQNGMIAGYRVRPGRDRAFFKSMGLRRNDIVTAVNGVSMSDPSTSLTLLDTLSTAKEVEVTVKRGSKEMKILLGLE
jgi:general secretion pathway protein C